MFAALRHDARHLSLDPARGLSDEDVVDLAIREDRMIVTQDLEFGRIYFFHRRGRVDIPVLRLARLSLPGMERGLREFLERTDLEGRGLHRGLIVLEPHRHRVLT